MLDQHQVRQFLLLVFVLLIPCFALWTVASTPLTVPAIGFINMLLTAWFPDIVNTVYVDGHNALLMTEFGEKNGALIPLKDAEYRLGFELNTRILSYSIPFYTALHFATQKSDYLNNYIVGLLVLYPLLVIGLLTLCLKELMVGVGPAFLNQTDVFVPNPNLIGISYQLSVLIVPTLAPAALWVWQNQDSPLLRGALARISKKSTAEPE